jgi:hypothetical protein
MNCVGAAIPSTGNNLSPLRYSATQAFNRRRNIEPPIRIGHHHGCNRLHNE